MEILSRNLWSKISKGSESVFWAPLGTKRNLILDIEQLMAMPSNPHTVCGVSSGNQNKVGHSSHELDVTHSVISWLSDLFFYFLLSDFISASYQMFPMPLTCDTPCVPLVPFCVLSHFGCPVSLCEAFNRCFCGVCFSELGFLSFQVPKTPCRACSACREEPAASVAGWMALCFLQLFPSQAGPVSLVVWSAFCSLETPLHPFR